MRLNDATVVIRPRSPWEAIDLGVLLARQHRRLLMSSWAVVTLPLFTVITALLWNHPWLAIALFWWLKPAYERLPLLILSRTLFGSTPTLKEALKMLPAALKPQLIASLTWRRFSLSRGFNLPVIQLEGLQGSARSQRIALLGQKDRRAARLLTLFASALELCLWIALMTLFYSMIPQQIEIDWSGATRWDVEGKWFWLEHLSNAFYALVLVLCGPVYVSCSFALYLNRRTHLEAWDLELAFRRLRQRVLGSVFALLMCMGLTLSAIPDAAIAGDFDAPSAYSCPLPPLDLPEKDQNVAPPNTARLLNQPLNSEDSRSTIKAVLNNPPFKNLQPESGWRLAESAKPSGKTGNTPGWLASAVAELLNVGRTLSTVLEGLLWGLVIVLVSWVAWRYRTWLSTFVSPQLTNTSVRPRGVQQLFGLQVSAESLPEDIASTAQGLWQQSPREALSLLYRALLSRLLTEYHLPLKSADTEGQVLERISQLNQPALSAFSHELTRHWRNLAYGHRLPPADAGLALCEDWRRLFAVKAAQ